MLRQRAVQPQGQLGGAREAGPQGRQSGQLGVQFQAALCRRHLARQAHAVAPQVEGHVQPAQQDRQEFERRARIQQRPLHAGRLGQRHVPLQGLAVPLATRIDGELEAGVLHLLIGCQAQLQLAREIEAAGAQRLGQPGVQDELARFERGAHRAQAIVARLARLYLQRQA
ncbi:hypothetical protein CCAE64S_01934 [Castellaniella caeni]